MNSRVRETGNDKLRLPVSLSRWTIESKRKEPIITAPASIPVARRQP